MHARAKCLTRLHYLKITKPSVVLKLLKFRGGVGLALGCFSCCKYLISGQLLLKGNRVGIKRDSILVLRCIHWFFWHCAKNHISQVLEYHGKLKKAMYISSFHQHFDWKKDRISHHRKVQNKNFSVTSQNHLSFNFLNQKRPFFPSPKSSKQDLFSNQ